MIARRAFDVGTALLGLILLSPLMAVVALAIKGTMGTPVLFRQLRSGRGGVEFVMVKFRTMRDIRSPDGQLLPDAQRVTRLGKLLRRTRLDELPELCNILAGEMAVVGPRPLLPPTIAAMGEAGRLRGSVRPGLTGWAQVNGNALLTNADKLALDLWYVRHASLRLDLAILLKTFGVVLFGEHINEDRLKGAYASDHRRGG